MILTGLSDLIRRTNHSHQKLSFIFLVTAELEPTLFLFRTESMHRREKSVRLIFSFLDRRLWPQERAEEEQRVITLLLLGGPTNRFFTVSRQAVSRRCCTVGVRGFNYCAARDVAQQCYCKLVVPVLGRQIERCFYRKGVDTLSSPLRSRAVHYTVTNDSFLGDQAVVTSGDFLPFLLSLVS